jgi:flagellar biosynthetic protein FliQ
MPDTLVADLARNAMLMALALAAPMLVVALGVGLLVSLVQAVTQIQEQTLAFVPKLLAVAMVFLVGLPWTIQVLVEYTTGLIRSLPALAS